MRNIITVLCLLFVVGWGCNKKDTTPTTPTKTFILYVRNDGPKTKKILVDGVDNYYYASGNGEITKIGSFDVKEDTHLQAKYFRNYNGGNCDADGYELVQDALIDTREMSVYTWYVVKGRKVTTEIAGNWDTDTTQYDQFGARFYPGDSMSIYVAKTSGTYMRVMLDRWDGAEWVSAGVWDDVTVVNQTLSTWSPDYSVYYILVYGSSIKGNWNIKSIAVY